MPLLRWPHDRHRGLRTRPGAEAQAITGGHRHQDRHVMNTRLMQDQTDAHPHRWPSARHRHRSCRRHQMASVAPARPIGLRRKPSPSHAKWPQTPPCARFRSHPRRTITAPYRPRPASIPIAPAAPPATTSRDFVPWRFSDAGHRARGSHHPAGIRETCTTDDVARRRRLLIIATKEKAAPPDGGLCTTQSSWLTESVFASASGVIRIQKRKASRIC